jgi:hypothetical protein
LNSSESEADMILNSAPVLATSLKALIRSALFTLGIDDVLIDFLANTAIRAATVLLTLLSVHARILPRGRQPHGRLCCLRIPQ